jgi:hypothetical protein
MRLIKMMKGKLVDTAELQKKSNNNNAAAGVSNTAVNGHAMDRTNNHAGTRMHASRHAIQQPRNN